MSERRTGGELLGFGNRLEKAERKPVHKNHAACERHSLFSFPLRKQWSDSPSLLGEFNHASSCGVRKLIKTFS